MGKDVLTFVAKLKLKKHFTSIKILFFRTKFSVEWIYNFGF